MNQSDYFEITVSKTFKIIFVSNNVDYNELYIYSETLTPRYMGKLKEVEKELYDCINSILNKTEEWSFIKDANPHIIVLKIISIFEKTISQTGPISSN